MALDGARDAGSIGRVLRPLGLGTAVAFTVLAISGMPELFGESPLQTREEVIPIIRLEAIAIRLEAIALGKGFAAAATH